MGFATAGEQDDDDMDMLEEEHDPDPDAMDWQPTTPARRPAPGQLQSPVSPLSRAGLGSSWAAWGSSNGNRNGGVDEATGLENLLARTNLADMDGGGRNWGGGGGGGAGKVARGGAGRGRGRGRGGRGGQEFEWRWVYVASLVPLTVAAYVAWRNVRGPDYS